MKKEFTKGLNLIKKEVKRMKKGLIFGLVVLSLLLSVTALYAYPTSPGNYNGLFFRNSEVAIDKDNSGTVSVGDTLWGVIKLNEITNAGNDNSGQTGIQIWPGAAPAEITGYFATDVLAVGAGPAPGTFMITFKPAAVDPKGILNVGAGEVLRLYEDNAVNFNDATQAQAFATATNGIFHSSLGLTNANDYWYSITTTLLLNLPPTPIGESYAGLDYVIKPFLVDKVNDPNESIVNTNVDLWFNSELFGKGTYPSNTLMHYGSNDPAVQHPTIPEPSTMILLGAGLIGIAAYGRKRLVKK